MVARWFASLALVACTIEDVPVEGKACPCPAPYVCIDDRCAAGCPASLIANPDFETGTGGWKTLTAEPTVTLTTVEGGFTGQRALRVCTGTDTTYTLDDDPATVFEPVNGTVYQADAWMRSVSGPQLGSLRIGEFSAGGASLEGSTSELELTDDWQQVTLMHTVSEARAGSTLDVRVRAINAPEGSCFEVDCIRLRDLAPSR